MAAGTVTYRWPGVVQGTTVAPTTAQVANKVVADVAMVDASTATTITHNFGTTATLGTPQISVICLTAGTSPCTPVFAFSSTLAITLANSTSASGSGCTWRVTIRRPPSSDQ